MKEFKELFDWIERRWNKPIGLILALIVVCGILFRSLHSVEDISIVAAVLILACACAEVTFLWLIHTVRAFQRTRYYMLIWVSLIFSIPIIFITVIYPYVIANSKYDILGIQYWGACLLFVLLIVLFYFILFKWNKNKDDIQIVFLVGNESDADKQIQDTLNEACCSIEEVCDAVKLRVAPFGIVKNKKTAERYVTSYLCQVDAVVYSRVMEGEEDGSCGYVFTEFCSFINTHRLTNDDERITDIDSLLSGESKYKSWNLRNRNKNDIADKLKVARSIEQLLRLYCACVFILKHKLSVAIDMAQALYQIDDPTNTRLKHLSCNLLEFAYLESATIEEQTNKDYEQSLAMLDKLKSIIPISRSLVYNLLMARVLFHLDRIPDSKQYTRKIKSVDPWGYCVNMGFYAMHEGKTPEFVSNYKRLLKSPAPSKHQVEFVIRFLKNEKDKARDSKYKYLLSCGIAFHLRYIDKKGAEKMVVRLSKQFEIKDGVKEIQKLFDVISSNNSFRIS